jgi:hypothetical protein
MPQVPTYDSPDVAPTTQGISAPAIDATQIAGDQIQKTGDALVTTGGLAEHVGNLVTRQVDQVRVDETNNTLRNYGVFLKLGSDDNGVHTPGWSSLAGKSVLNVMGDDGKPAPLTQANDAKFQKKIDELSADLTPNQQRMFSMSAMNMQSENHNEVAAHQAQQFGVYAGMVNSDKLVSSANTLAGLLPQMNSPQYPVLAQTQWDNIDQAVNQKLATDGVITLDPKTNQPIFNNDDARNTYEIERKSIMAKLIGTVVQAGVNNQQAPAAMKFLEGQKDNNLLPADYDAIHQKVAQAAMGSTAVSQVDAITNKLWTDPDKAPDEVAIDKALRDANVGDSDQLNASRAELHNRIASWGFTKTKTESESTQAADADIAAGKSIQYIKQQPYYTSMNGSQQLEVANKATNFSNGLIAQSQDAAGRAGSLNADMINYAMQAHHLSEPQARALAALSVGEGGQLDNTNSDGGGHGAYGLFQIRDSGGQKELKQIYGPHPTMENQVDYFIQHYSKGNSGFFNASNEIDAFNALAVGQKAGDAGTQGIRNRGYAALTPPKSAAADKADHSLDAQNAFIDINQNGLKNFGDLSPQSNASVMGNYGNYWGQKLIRYAQNYQKAGEKATVSHDEYSTAAKSLGLNPGSKAPADAALLANLQSTIQQALVDQFHATGKVATPDERNNIITKAAAATVQVNGWGSSVWGPSTMPLARVAPTDASNIVVPPDQIDMMKAAAAKHGVPFDINQARTMYLRSLHSPLSGR